MIDKKLVEAVLEVLDDEKNFTQEQAELLLFYVDTKNEPLKKAFAPFVRPFPLRWKKRPLQNDRLPK